MRFTIDCLMVFEQPRFDLRQGSHQSVDAPGAANPCRVVGGRDALAKSFRVVVPDMGKGGLVTLADVAEKFVGEVRSVAEEPSDVAEVRSRDDACRRIVFPNQMAEGFGENLQINALAVERGGAGRAAGTWANHRHDLERTNVEQVLKQ